MRLHRHEHTLRLICALLFIGSIPVAAGAGVVYDNGAPNHANATAMTSQLLADDFTFIAVNTVTDVRFWTYESTGGYSGSLTWQIYSDSSGNPGSVLFSGSTSSVTRAPTGIHTFGLDEFQNDFSISSATLASGTYWLSIHNGPLTQRTPPNETDYDWESAPANGTNPGKVSISDPFGATWDFNTNNFAFQLISNVPEPTSACLLVLASHPLLKRSRRRF